MADWLARIDRDDPGVYWCPTCGAELDQVLVRGGALFAVCRRCNATSDSTGGLYEIVARRDGTSALMWCWKPATSIKQLFQG
jgi:hypothetical protein